MSNYSPTTDFSIKDGLTPGDSEKIILGSDFDVEFDAIATHIATKYDTTSLASQAQAEAGTDNTTLMTPLRAEQWGLVWEAENAGMAGDIRALADPGADTILGWDDSAGAAISFSVSTGLTTSTTNLLLDAASNLNTDHSAVTLTAGTGLSGGGDITTNRSFEVDMLGLEDLSDPGADKIFFWDDSSGFAQWLTPVGMTFTGTVFTVDAATTTTSGIVERATQTEVNTGSDTTRYITPGTLALWDGGTKANRGIYHGRLTGHVGGSPVIAGDTGWTASDDAAGETTVTHNLGHANYTVQAMCFYDGAGGYLFPNITDRSINSFTIKITGGTSGVDQDYDFIVITDD